MKLFRSIFAVALVVGLGFGVLSGCSDGMAISKNMVEFGYYNVGQDDGVHTVATENITGENGNYIITLPASNDIQNFEIDLKIFFAANDEVLGSGFTFTRSDKAGLGYAYVMVNDVGSAADNTYKKYGTADTTAVSRDELPAGPKLYVTTTGAQAIALYINAPEGGFSATGTNVKFVFNGDNGEKHFLNVTVKKALAS